MAFIQACQYISHLYRRASRSTLSTRPQPDASEANLTEKKMRLHSISETVDLGVADQLLVQRSRKHTNTSSSEQGENLWLEAKETLIDIKSQSEDLERRSLSNPAVEILKSNRLTGSDLSSSRTPRPLCLVPAKRLRPSPRAQALQLEAKKSGELAPRQINNQSAFSEKSNTTVNHDPSKRSHSPITVPDIVIFENTIDPFSDNNALRRSSDGSSNLRSSQSTGNRDSSKELRSTEEKIFEKYKIRRMVTNRSQTESKSHRTSSDAASRRLLENASPARRDFARREFARSKALLAFNLSAPYFGLKTLTPLTSSIPTMGECFCRFLSQNSHFLTGISCRSATSESIGIPLAPNSDRQVNVVNETERKCETKITPNENNGNSQFTVPPRLPER